MFCLPQRNCFESKVSNLTADWQSNVMRKVFTVTLNGNEHNFSHFSCSSIFAKKILNIETYRKSQRTRQFIFYSNSSTYNVTPVGWMLLLSSKQVPSWNHRWQKLKAFIGIHSRSEWTYGEHSISRHSVEMEKLHTVLIIE